MKNRFNTLIKYVYDYSDKTYNKEIVDSLFRAITEPLMNNQKIESCVLIRTHDSENKISILKRLLFSGVKIFNFGNNIAELDLENCCLNDIWGTTEFFIILSQRYSSALVWDYTTGEIKNTSKTCILCNSKIISDIAKHIAENSTKDLSTFIKQYSPDRRENTLLNKSIKAIADSFSEKSNEYRILEYEKNSLIKNNEDDNISKIVTSKARFISHEIKNYLSIINLYSKIVNKRLELLNDVKEQENIEQINNSLKNITNASENISYLITDLRCLSTVYKSEYKLKKIIEEALNLCSIKVEQEKAKLECDYGSISDNTVITTDKARIQCAITNIVFNALEANAINIKVEVQTNKILIKNDGKEIPELIRARIFEENFTTKEQGNGIGLSFCKKQLQNIGGDINLVSSDKTITVFEIKFN